MRREDIEKLLGGYATGTLTREERKLLFEAALNDAALFEQLAAEEPLRELLEDRAARAELRLATLAPEQEEAEPFYAAVARMARRTPEPQLPSRRQRMMVWTMHPVRLAGFAVVVVVVAAISLTPVLRRTKLPAPGSDIAQLKAPPAGLVVPPPAQEATPSAAAPALQKKRGDLPAPAGLAVSTGQLHEREPAAAAQPAPVADEIPATAEKRENSSPGGLLRSASERAAARGARMTNALRDETHKVAPRPFQYSLLKRTERGYVAVAGTEVFDRADELRLRLQAAEPAFVTVDHIQPSGNLMQLFAGPLEESREISLPDTPGEMRLRISYSPFLQKPLAQPESQRLPVVRQELVIRRK